jgi:pimeloyl-ACP methyl ester carboxylesterase
MLGGRPATRFVRVNGIRLAYAEWPGRAAEPPLICLPHLTGHKGSFGPLAERFAPDYRVFALDLRGRGESDCPDDGYGFAYHARDILAFADSLGLSEFTLVGHSFGATAGVYLASVHPRRIHALVLMDGGADPRPETLRAMVATIHQLGQCYPTLQAYLAGMRANPFYQPWSASLEQYFSDDVRRLSDGTVCALASPAAVERDLDLHFHYSMCLHFPALRCPVLFLRPELGLLGDRGHVFSESEARAITSNIPNCRRVDVPGVNHYTMLLHDNPPVAPAIREFLNEHT